MPCPFCSPDKKTILLETEAFLVLWDKYPVTEGHALVIPRRHIESFFDMNDQERSALMVVLDQVRGVLEDRFHPDGFNIGVNIGSAAGQSVEHMHVHVIPRRQDDMERPRGGVRHVIPKKGNY